MLKFLKLAKKAVKVAKDVATVASKVAVVITYAIEFLVIATKTFR